MSDHGSIMSFAGNRTIYYSSGSQKQMTYMHGTAQRVDAECFTCVKKRRKASDWLLLPNGRKASPLQNLFGCSEVDTTTSLRVLEMRKRCPGQQSRNAGCAVMPSPCCRLWRRKRTLVGSRFGDRLESWPYLADLTPPLQKLGIRIS